MSFEVRALVEAGRRPQQRSSQMATRLDHLILNVNDREKSLAFYTRILGFAHEGEREGTPFSVIKVEPDFMLQLAPFGTRGGEHLAFSMSLEEFDQTFQRVREARIKIWRVLRHGGQQAGARG
jgi:catechol 2,3-dioxygenase-like lactoylglutathione lyase family enzyme